MFKFLKDDDGESTPEKRPDADGNGSDALPAAEVLVCERHYKFIAQDARSKMLLNSLRSDVKTIVDTDIKYLQIASLLSHPQVDARFREILCSTSDLVPSVYEGGFKIWECTLDLIRYLEAHKDSYQFGKVSTVLDLGCGSGLLGLYAMSRGSVVHFQDYNPEVLHHLTIPNVLLNHGDEVVASCRFFSGDWASLRTDVMTADRIDEFQYDYILTSETTYNVGSFPKLYSLMKHCLKSTGVVLLASKTCYFGVGGGTQAFLRHVERDGAMNAETVSAVREGVQREVIALRFKT